MLDTCPSCDRQVRVVDGRYSTHDIDPMLRSVCMASGSKRPQIALDTYPPSDNPCASV